MLGVYKERVKTTKTKTEDMDNTVKVRWEDDIGKKGRNGREGDPVRGAADLTLTILGFGL
jgi:hypothetical protein